MRNRSAPLFALGAAVLTAAAGMHPASADDTEIYLGQPTQVSQSSRPNVLFILDTSGSMNGNVNTQTTYDPNVTYSGNCATGRIYWKSSTASFSGVPVRSNCNFKGDSDSTTAGYVNDSAFKCQTSRGNLNSLGYSTVTRTAQWFPRSTASNSRWQALRRASAADPVECGDDSDPNKMNPPHGDGTRAYAANGSNGPYTNDASQQINWNSADTAGTYTYYTSNYLNWYYNAQTVSKTRLEIVQESLRNTVAGLSQANVGLMRFSTDGDGGMVLKEVANVSTARQDILDAINGLFPTGTTPLAETYYEAARYWFGMQWDFGRTSQPTVSVRASRRLDNDQVYLSPVSASCQKNFIVYLTDGEPVSDSVNSTRYGSLPGFQDYLNEHAGVTSGGQCTPNEGTNNTNGVCLDDLAGYLYNTDIDNSLPGVQNVITYSVGFGSDVQNVNWAIELLENTAERGGGEFYQAGDTATLTEVFNNIIQEIMAVNTTFTAPAVAVNAFNRTQNLDDLYISVFGTPQPPSGGNTYHWPGNIKKYEIRPDGTIVGANGAAVDPVTGFFRTTARSFWSDVVDGSDVQLGGAAHEIPTPADRRIYTDLVQVNGRATLVDNPINVGNMAITSAMLGIDASALITRDLLIEWVRGADINAADPADRDEPRYKMGDPLHSRPATVIYGGTATNPDIVLFAATNDGYLHAIDGSTGAELWSYVPSQLLRRMKDLYENRAQPAKRYALDGNIRAFKLDENNNGIVDENDKVYLFFGMGRGGESYYALDVTSKTSPRLMWRRGSASEILADGQALPASQQLPGLAQTWSTPVVTKVNVGGTVRLVVIFGGGYDPSQDNINYNTDDVGNRIYMLDAETGDIVWRAGPDTDGTAHLKINSSLSADRRMNNSIPADIRVIDLDGNQIADRMYAADMGGRVWRFDIHNGEPAASLVTGGVFASLGMAGGNGSNPTDARRFYYAPDVAMLRTETGVFFNLAIGSGYRGHPLDETIHDRFYALRDHQPFVKKTQEAYDTFAFIEDNSTGLVDVTTDISPTIPPAGLGWKMDLSQPSWQGEKILSEAVTFQNAILFTSYLPQAGDSVEGSTSCVARQGRNRLYTVFALDGRPVLNRDGSTDANGNVNQEGDEVEDRWGDLNQGGIAPEAVILFPGTSTPACIVGVESCGVSFSNNPVRTFWNQRHADPSN